MQPNSYQINIGNNQIPMNIEITKFEVIQNTVIQDYELNDFSLELIKPYQVHTFVGPLSELPISKTLILRWTYTLENNDDNLYVLSQNIVNFERLTSIDSNEMILGFTQ